MYVKTHTGYAEREAQTRLEAVRLAKLGQKSQSLFHVNTAIRLQRQMTALQSIIGKLQDSIYHLELTSHAMEAAGAIRVGSDALRSVNGEAVITNIEEAIDSLQEDGDAADDISGALEGGSGPSVDAEAVLAEWMQTDTHMPEQALATLPEAPQTKLVAPAVPARQRVAQMQMDV